MAKVVVITGSPSRNSRLFGIVDYAIQALEQKGFEVTSVHATDLPAEDLLFARFDSPAIQQAVQEISTADAVIVASPVYKASYTGLLKALLDLLPQKGLTGKPVLPLFIGGTIAHFLSIDYALKPVLSSLGARHLLTGVFAVDSQVTRDEQGAAVLNDELRTRLDVSVAEFEEIVRLITSKSQDQQASAI
ncbi:NADPH-dependent FMN reductase [Paenibacillus pinihumi]|uniref:NADPH-dependent FMN reductase n=1 Tax=Paenibacillus pinihumi TaxID=669462 RepID=UPI00048D2CF6|nr:NADPH-dependent FMN reductase [Paenibacillus pinihumi]